MMNGKFNLHVIILLPFLIFLYGSIDATEHDTSSTIPDNVVELWKEAQIRDRSLQGKELSPDFVHRGGKWGKLISGNYKVHLKSMERIHRKMNRLPITDTRRTLRPVINTLKYEIIYENAYLVGASPVIDLLDVLRKDRYLPEGFIAKIKKLRPESYFSTAQVYTGWMPILTKMTQGKNISREAKLSEIETKVWTSHGLMEILIAREESEVENSPPEGALNEAVKENTENFNDQV
ncbi:hypothetical protein Ddc_09747 [Ditylenchus destructor]|nr:hypothetical protein Ddc_09747 [Ditylenchus destructor]